MQATVAVALVGACVTGGLLLAGSGPGGVVGPLGAAVGVGLGARLRLPGSPGAGLDPWSAAGPEALGAALFAAAALAAADTAPQPAASWVARLAFFGLLGYMTTFASSYSASRSAGQTLYNMAFSGALWAWLARLFLELARPPAEALARPGQAFLQGALLGFLMAVPRIARPQAEGTENR
ncbi:MAG: hypothetical protein HY816_11895 [Candidatus Wallbacteria bacterium]|nr:hypothetical protein [Candidatus Wallbacteria bacterium]